MVRKGYERYYLRGVSWRLNRTATYWPPQLFWPQQYFFLVLLGCSTGGWGPSLCWDMVLIPTSSLQLMWISCRRGYIIIWRPSTSFERHNSHSIQPFDNQGYPLIPDIFNWMQLLFTQVHFSSDNPAGSEVCMLHIQ